MAYIRAATEEPGIQEKYSDEDIIALMRDAWGELWVDLNNNTRHPLTMAFKMSIKADQLEYQLPPGIGRIERVVQRNEETNGVRFEIDPRGRFDLTGWGWRAEGNTLRLGRKWKDTDDLQVEYIPSGDVSFITSSWTGPVNYTGKTLTLNGTTANGILDTRVQAYTGYMLRTVPPPRTSPVPGRADTIQQERVISSYDHTNLNCTLWNDLDPTINLSSNQTLDYEILPWMNRDMERAVMVRAALIILSNEGNMERLKTQSAEYVKCVRSVRLFLTNRPGRKAGQFDGAVPENKRRNRRFGRFGVVGT